MIMTTLSLPLGGTGVYGLLMHPTAPALPAALAIAESHRMPGKDLMLAYQLGVEVACKIAEAISPRHYQHGFHSTATCGALASASVAGKLYGLDLEMLLAALAIAASQSAGLRENFGTMTKPFHAGRSSESGIVAADLARLGWSASDKILESPRGFFQAHGGGYDLESIQGKLGNPWTFDWPGVSIKPHPSGSLTHPGMTRMLELILNNDIKPEEVERIDVGANHNMPNALIHHRPKNELQAKFSMEFCMAILMLERRAGLAEFTDEVVNRRDVQSMIEKINFHVHPEAEAAGYDKMTTIIDIHRKDGTTISGRADFGKGSPADPMSYDEVARKFRELRRIGWMVIGESRRDHRNGSFDRTAGRCRKPHQSAGQITAALSRCLSPHFCRSNSPNCFLLGPDRAGGAGEVAPSASLLLDLISSISLKASCAGRTRRARLGLLPFLATNQSFPRFSRSKPAALWAVS